MQPEEKYTCDLEYLAQLGFEKVPAGMEDINELKKKIRSRTFSYNHGSYFGIISLLVGAFLGISVFFYVYEPAPGSISHKTEKITVTPGNIPDNYGMHLDTVNVISENFIKPAAANQPVKQVEKKVEQDTTINIATLPMSATLSSIPEKITETQIKYIPNSPIIFLHDLKITDYSSLYFRHNKFVTLSVKEGLDASYANPSEKEATSALSPTGNYYMHQAISDAMLYFSRKEYNRCLNSLEMIQEINPSDINCKFYSGMCYFYKKNYKKALTYFEDCINNSNNAFLNEALYYKACSLNYSGDTEKATVIFREIADEGSFYSEKAKQFLN
jgi:hypothetical protein